MTYMIVKNHFLNWTERYLDIVKSGNEDCNLDKKYLKKHLSLCIIISWLKNEKIYKIL